MSKNKPFKPPAGFVVGVHINMLGIKALAKELNMEPITVAQACERAGMMLQPDIMDLSGDSAKVLLEQQKKKVQP